MTRKQFISLILGLLLTLVVYTAIAYLLLIITFNLGGQTLSEKENDDTLFFYTALGTTILTIIFFLWKLNTKKKYAAIGIGIPLVIAFYAVLNFGLVFYHDQNYYQSFDKNKWQQAVPKPVKMAKTLTKEKKLIRLTQNQVIDMLGNGVSYPSTDRIQILRYRTTENWILQLEFMNGIVVKAYLHEPGWFD